MLSEHDSPSAPTSTSRPWPAGVAGCSVLLAGLLLVLVFGDAPERTLFWDAVFDAGHVPLFGLSALAILGLLSARSSGSHRPRTWWAAFAITLAVGAVSEVLQVFQPNREPSIDDLLRDAAGAGAFLLLAAVAESWAAGVGPLGTRAGRTTAVLLAVSLLLASSARLLTTVSMYIARSRACPTLFALDGSWWERRLVHPRDSRLTPRTAPPGLEGRTAEPLARLDLRPGLYPGVTFQEPYPDWTGYHNLVFTVVSDLDVPLSLVIRVHDALHDQRHADRFNRSLVIQPGVNHVTISIDDIRRAPDRREMDLTRIRGVVLFGYRLGEATHVYLGALRLE